MFVCLCTEINKQLSPVSSSCSCHPCLLWPSYDTFLPRTLHSYFTVRPPHVNPFTLSPCNSLTPSCLEWCGDRRKLSGLPSADVSAPVQSLEHNAKALWVLCSGFFQRNWAIAATPPQTCVKLLPWLYKVPCFSISLEVSWMLLQVLTTACDSPAAFNQTRL